MNFKQYYGEGSKRVLLHYYLGVFPIIKVTKKEAETLRKKMPDLYITRTVHHYYVPEEPRVIRALRKML